LSNYDLSGADLSHATLRRANLTNANLTKANLTDVDLTEANLMMAKLDGMHERANSIDSLHVALTYNFLPGGASEFWFCRRDPHWGQTLPSRSIRA